MQIARSTLDSQPHLDAAAVAGAAAAGSLRTPAVGTPPQSPQQPGLPGLPSSASLRRHYDNVDQVLRGRKQQAGGGERARSAGSNGSAQLSRVAAALAESPRFLILDLRQAWRPLRPRWSPAPPAEQRNGTNAGLSLHAGLWQVKPASTVSRRLAARCSALQAGPGFGRHRCTLLCDAAQPAAPHGHPGGSASQAGNVHGSSRPPRTHAAAGCLWQPGLQCVPTTLHRLCPKWISSFPALVVPTAAVGHSPARGPQRAHPAKVGRSRAGAGPAPGLGGC